MLIKNFKIGNDLPLFLIAGPCQVESEEHSLFMADQIAKLAKKLAINFCYKSSFDKANRSSLEGPRGIGLEASCKIFDKIKEIHNCPIISDIHHPDQASLIAPHLDIIQIPAFLSRQTDLIVAAAKTGKVINVKKGQFLAPEDMLQVLEKAKAVGNDQVIFTERGTSFGYHNLVNDFRGLKIMKDLGQPVIFDATHSVQLPGALGKASSGRKDLIETLARSAVATGIAGIFIETHQEPEKAPSDASSMLPLEFLEPLLIRLKALDEITKSYPYLTIKS
jgi:2-dehydro-3-deoxyphosphooctonate aldolase (KDO 8-P synthase)